jgi:hypothetical protein
MDWSLLQPNAKKRFLRDVRGFKNPNWYYAAMIIDPILRFNWIFYAVYTHDLQHNTICSFLVALSEVTRRGMWTAFRVENEHSANVARFKASRDVPLPYDLESGSQESLAEDNDQQAAPATPALSSRSRSRTTALEPQPSETSSLARRPTRTFTSMLANAHTQDFEKKRKPGVEDSDDLKRSRGGEAVGVGAAGDSSDDDDEDDDERDVEDAMEVEGLIGGRNGGV